MIVIPQVHIFMMNNWENKYLQLIKNWRKYYFKHNLRDQFLRTLIEGNIRDLMICWGRYLGWWDWWVRLLLGFIAVIMDGVFSKGFVKSWIYLTQNLHFLVTMHFSLSLFYINFVDVSIKTKVNTKNKFKFRKNCVNF